MVDCPGYIMSVFNRPGVAGAVLQTPHMIHVICHVPHIRYQVLGVIVRARELQF